MTDKRNARNVLSKRVASRRRDPNDAVHVNNEDGQLDVPKHVERSPFRDAVLPVSDEAGQSLANATHIRNNVAEHVKFRRDGLWVQTD